VSTHFIRGRTESLRERERERDAESDERYDKF